MATRQKKKNNPEKNHESRHQNHFALKKEKIDWKQLARDERTWKIVGTIFILIAIFLFISFISYLFTWEEDQDITKKGSICFIW